MKSIKFRYQKEEFEDLLEIKFENHLFYITKDYDRILKMQYGNYMELPPQKDRKPHHNYNAFYIE